MARTAEAVMARRGPINIDIIDVDGEHTAVVERNGVAFTATPLESRDLLNGRISSAKRGRKVWKTVGAVGLAGGAALIAEGVLLGGGGADAVAGLAVEAITLPTAAKNVKRWALEQEFVQEAMEDLRSGMRALRRRKLQATLTPQGQ